MKIIISLLLLFSFEAFATPPQQWTPWPTNNRTYLIYDRCPAPCYPMVENGVVKNLATHDVKDVQVDDITKPIYSTPNTIEPCSSVLECSNLIRAHCPVEGVNNCPIEDLINYCQAPDLPYYRSIGGGSYEAYCTHLTGYQQKTVKKLVLDSAKLAAYNAANSAAATEAAAKAAKALTRRTVMIACAKLDATATAAQIRTCTIANSRELVRQYLLSSEE